MKLSALFVRIKTLNFLHIAGESRQREKFLLSHGGKVVTTFAVQVAMFINIALYMITSSNFAGKNPLHPLKIKAL